MGARRDELVRVARRLFVRGGPDAMTMRAVAKEVGITATAVYRHFADKDSLIEAVVAAGRDAFAAYLFDALAGEGPRERLRLTGLRYLDFAIEHPEDYQVFFLSWDRLPPPPDQAGRTPPTRQFLMDRIAECAGLLREGTDPMRAAVFLWAEVHGLAAFWISGGARHAMPLEAFRALAATCIEHAVASVLREQT